MRRALVAAAALLAALAAPAAARAADQTVRAVDGTSGAWSPPGVTVAAGDTVTWSFAGTVLAHNVEAGSPNWTAPPNPIATNHPPVAYTFASPGTYTFVCAVHRGTMTGTVTVTDAAGTPPPPPPPPPPSEQPFPNDQPAPAVPERADETRPRLARVRAARMAHGIRVHFRVSEAARVTIRVMRGHRTVRRRTVHAAATRSVRLRGLRAGPYRIEVRARDLAGNRSRARRARVVVR